MMTSLIFRLHTLPRALVPLPALDAAVRPRCTSIASRSWALLKLLHACMLQVPNSLLAASQGLSVVKNGAFSGLGTGKVLSISGLFYNGVKGPTCCVRSALVSTCSCQVLSLSAVVLNSLSDCWLLE